MSAKTEKAALMNFFGFLMVLIKRFSLFLFKKKPTLSVYYVTNNFEKVNERNVFRNDLHSQEHTIVLASCSETFFSFILQVFQYILPVV